MERKYKKDIDTGSDFSGVGSFDQALERLGIKQNKIFACDSDKYARETYILNYGQPEYYPKDVYEREIPEKALDIYMTSPPCQGFSLTGKRAGSILFLNSYEFIKINKPRHFIFENVKGLLSHERTNEKSEFGNTFNQWLNYLGGKSVNGVPVIFPTKESVPYHIYHKVLNSKDHGIPQNRERVFIIGIRDDSDNHFQFPKEKHLSKRLQDVLEENIDKKYFLSEKMISYFTENSKKNEEKGNGFRFTPKNKKEDIANTITTKTGSRMEGNYINENTSKIIVHEVPETVSIRKNDVNIQELQHMLKKHKTTTIEEISKTLKTNQTTVAHWFRTDQYFSIPDAEIWNELKDLLKIKTNEFDASIMEFTERQGVFEKRNRVYDINGIAPTLTCATADERITDGNKIRRLSPLECFRLMDFNENFKWNVSDTQAYKQAGNSIVVGVLEQIISKLNL